MTRAISRDSFNELKQYLGVHLQQGRVILDSDWNEGQDILAALTHRLGQDALRDGVANEGFEIQPVIPVPWGPQIPFRLSYYMAGLPVHNAFPTATPLLDGFEALDGWTLPAPPAKLRLGRDRPYTGKTFLRLSDHTGPVTLTRTLTTPIDLSASQFAHFRFRLNQTFALPPAPLPGTASFFVEDITGHRNVWKMTGLWNAKELWAPSVALPLDLRFHIVDLELLPAYVGKPYFSSVVTVGAPSTVAWSVLGTLPPGVSLVPRPNTHYARLTGTPTAAGTFTFTITATSGTAVSRTFTVHVQDSPIYPQLFNGDVLTNDLQQFWDNLKARTSKPTGTAANLSTIKKYGFEVFQGSPALVWDFDALQVGSRSLVNTMAANNFSISGPLATQLIRQLQISTMANDEPAVTEEGQALLPQLAAVFRRRPRAYAGGLACTQTRDLLYAEQADPGDPPLHAPTGTTVRKDLVYLDVWREPVTYVEDPDLREIALGGPDTSTRMRVRQRLRVAQGGELPAGDGTGLGTLATEGSYTDRTNRLYLVEVDTAGEIGSATVRWSDDNGSTIQRVIEPIAPGATKVKVEDASAFQPGDFILLRTEFQVEEHRVAGVFGNTITLQAPGGIPLPDDDLDAEPVAAPFALADRPKVQRWNGFHAPIVPDPGDSTISAPIALSFGVKIRFGGRAFKKGDFWTFRTRYLAGDEASGINAIARIETVEFEGPQGVVHHYTPLGALIRDPAAHEPGRIKLVRDLRRHAGQVVFHRGDHHIGNLTGTTALPTSLVPLGLASSQSTFLCLWSAQVNAPIAGTALRLDVEFFDNSMTNPDIKADTVSTRSTTIVCEATGPRDRTAFVIRHSTDENLLFESGLVAARAFVTLLNNTTSTVVLSGRLDLIEVRNELLNLADISD